MGDQSGYSSTKDAAPDDRSDIKNKSDGKRRDSSTEDAAPDDRSDIKKKSDGKRRDSSTKDAAPDDRASNIKKGSEGKQKPPIVFLAPTGVDPNVIAISDSPPRPLPHEVS